MFKFVRTFIPQIALGAILGLTLHAIMPLWLVGSVALVASLGLTYAIDRL